MNFLFGPKYPYEVHETVYAKYSKLNRNDKIIYKAVYKLYFFHFPKHSFHTTIIFKKKKLSKWRGCIFSLLNRIITDLYVQILHMFIMKNTESIENKHKTAQHRKIDGK